MHSGSSTRHKNRSQDDQEPSRNLQCGLGGKISAVRIARIVAEEMGLRDATFTYTDGVDGGRSWRGDVKNMLLDITILKSRGGDNHSTTTKKP